MGGEAGGAGPVPDGVGGGGGGEGETGLGRSRNSNNSLARLLLRNITNSAVTLRHCLFYCQENNSCSRKYKFSIKSCS